MQAYTKRHNILLCVDSDGCAIDSMEIKHRSCFGPAFADQYPALDQADVLEQWNQTNLYTKTRGINRFAGYAVMLQLYSLEGATEFADWVNGSLELSQRAVEKLAEGAHPVFGRALAWSRDVNRRIETLPLPQPFTGVQQALERFSGIADIAVVSSANRTAVEEEWKQGGLLSLLAALMTQDDGTKSDCIARLRQQGYHQILMVGDAPGDCRAAKANGASFFPILAGQETTSWQVLGTEVYERVAGGGYTPSVEALFLVKFWDNLQVPQEER